MSDKVTVKFEIKESKYNTEKGRWCNVCKWVLTQGITKDMLLISTDPGLMSISLNCMASARLFTKEETCHAACISISITTSTRKGVKRRIYLLAIRRFHRILLKYRKVTRLGIEPRTFWTYTRCSNQLSYLALVFNQLILYLCNCQPKDTYSARHIQCHSLHARSTLWPRHDQISQSGNHVTDYIIQFQQIFGKS